ncbi:MAG: hypothetical protein QOE70_1775 [Chthoniobacter sp.]|jgi:hypothetical protein|nr:hypothetical protein [Chthoniobacter sp.]
MTHPPFLSLPPLRRRVAPFLGFALLALTVVGSGAEKVSFNRDIRPILSENCFQCHGTDAEKREGKLRLDQRESALKGGESGLRSLVPGKPDESELMLRILTDDPDDHMPSKKTGKVLKPQQIELLRRWISEGAEYQGHWSFIKPERPAVPSIADGGLRIADWEKREPARGAALRKEQGRLEQWARNPIDQLILDRLLREGLAPSPDAAPEVICRRMFLDLTGLPPTPEEVDAFRQSTIRNPQSAIEALADRLLASPRYGEWMAVQWLDFARYADSNGFQSDTSRQMWHWRDWVIDAFNRNLPFDRFTIEQLAGDLLPNPTREQIVATGFQRNQRLNGEGGRIIEEWFAETIIDRIETTGATWLGLTLGCARCHDHKFDPISQKEFYQLFAFFNSNDENGVLDEFGGSGPRRGGGNSRPVLSLPTPEQEKELAKLESAAKAAEQRAAEAQKLLPRLQKEWETKLSAQLDQQAEAWQPLAPTEVKSEGGATFTRQEDGSWLAGGKNPRNDTYTITTPIAAGEFTGLRIEALPDPSLPNKSLGRAGNFVLTGVEAEITASSLPQHLPVDFARAEADYEQKGYEAKLIIDENPKAGKGAKSRKGWAVDGGDPAKRLPRQAMFVVGTPVPIPPDATLIVRLKHESQFTDHNIGRFRLATTSLPPAVVKLKGAGTPESIRVALATDAAKRTPKQREELAKFHRENTDNPASRATTEVTEARKKLTDFKATLPTTMVMKELPQPRDAFVLTRGEYDKKGEKVPRGLPASLPPLPAGAPVNRLGLAQWIVSPENPLTARVWVNRAWERFFGIGLVKTSENLGSQSEWPAHPELLDWLATEFVRRKWDMKAMHKLIVTSATYRQSARVTPELHEKDLDNRLLARGPRFRLTGEAVRDSALAASGLLVEKVGGPSVRPYMPKGVWDETSVYGDLRNYEPAKGEDLYRRTLYTIWKRTAAPPTALLFDAPNREICTVKRSRTNTPLQALALLNEVTFVEAARKLAERMISEGGATPADRVQWAFRRALSRAPDEDELKILTAGLESQLAKYRANPDAAAQLITFGARQSSPTLAPAELAAYTVTANVLLNLDEFVTR